MLYIPNCGTPHRLQYHVAERQTLKFLGKTNSQAQTYQYKSFMHVISSFTERVLYMPLRFT